MAFRMYKLPIATTQEGIRDKVTDTITLNTEVCSLVGEKNTIIQAIGMNRNIII